MRPKAIPVYNCNSSTEKPVTWQECGEFWTQGYHKFPFEKKNIGKSAKRRQPQSLQWIQIATNDNTKNKLRLKTGNSQTDLFPLPSVRPCEKVRA